MMPTYHGLRTSSAVVAGALCLGKGDSRSANGIPPTGIQKRRVGEGKESCRELLLPPTLLAPVTECSLKTCSPRFSLVLVM